MTGLMIGGFLVFLFSPQKALAQSLDIWYSAGTVYVNDLIDVDITTSPTRVGLNITLQTLSRQTGTSISWVQVNPASKTCVTDQQGGCPFRIQPTQAGIFALGASAGPGSGYPAAPMSGDIIVINRTPPNSAFQLQLLSPATGPAGQNIQLLVGTNPSTDGVNINFRPVGSPNPFLGDNCITSNGSCSVLFRSGPTQAGTFKVNARGTPTCGTPIVVPCGVPSSTDPALDIDVTVTATLPPVLPPSTDYTLLAPLPNPDGGAPLDTLDVSETGALGKYLNIIIKLVIGLAAVLAMVMIVIGGVEYITSELPGGKSGGIERITNAVFGLLIALGAYVLLFTINPNLLKTDFEIAQAKVEVLLEEAIPSDTGTPPGITARCQAGIQKTTINMFACGDILQNINNMLGATRSAGLNITGGGYRTVEEQRQLRIKNCKGDFTNPSAQCNPPTALPGQSNHNNGKAFDLKCDGVFIQTRDNKCFLWLQTNAITYGLRNLSSEPWHWSTDGK